MDQVTVKTTKRGFTVHVPDSQSEVFHWVLQEGLAGLTSVCCDNDQSEPIAAEGHLDKWNGIIWK